MALEIIRGDLVRMQADAIVSPANAAPVLGAGTEQAIHAAAGPELLRARQALGVIPCGESAVTPAFRLAAKYVIHTVSPVWQGGGRGEERLLYRAYESALEAARAKHCRSAALPLLGTGSCGFPGDPALSAAVRACGDFLQHHRMQILLVGFRQQGRMLSAALQADVRCYVDARYESENELQEGRAGRSCFGRLERLQSSEKASEPRVRAPAEQPEQLRRSLEERLQHKHETFTQSMLRIIREQDWQEPEVYGRILMDRKTFNKIRNNPEHHPQRRTALQLVFALRLNSDQARDLLARAGYALSDASKSDLILSYCLEQGIYDIDEIDALLDALGEKTLFSLR